MRVYDTKKENYSNEKYRKNSNSMLQTEGNIPNSLRIYQLEQSNSDKEQSSNLRSSVLKEKMKKKPGYSFNNVYKNSEQLGELADAQNSHVYLTTGRENLLNNGDRLLEIRSEVGSENHSKVIQLYSEDDIRRRAQQIYDERVEKDISGNATSDWQRAEKELRKIESRAFRISTQHQNNSVPGDELSNWLSAEQEYIGPIQNLTRTLAAGIFPDTVLTHIFYGDRNTTKKPRMTGYHSEAREDANVTFPQNMRDRAGNDVPNRSVQGSQYHLGVESARVQNVHGESKFSTLFPAAWSPQEIVTAVEEAYNDINKHNLGNDLWQGMGNHINIQMYIRGGVITTAFPAN